MRLDPHDCDDLPLVPAEGTAVQSTTTHRHAAPSGEHRTPATPHEARAAESHVALVAGVCGLLADAAYVLAVAVPLGDVAGPVVASVFGPLIAAASVALYLLLAAARATLAGQLAAIANVVAGGLVTAMLLVQISVNDVDSRLSPAVNDAFEHVEFGLDLSWDVFLAAGTFLFGCAMLSDARFGRRFALPGMVVAAALYALNFASFPTPPGDAGLVDLGPLIGLWYAAVSVQALRLRRRTGHRVSRAVEGK
jgi:hypothetical protein